MVLERAREPLRPMDLPVPEPGPGQVAIEVRACAVCRTDLHIVDGELTEPKLPLVPGHQIAGRVTEGGERFEPGQRVGVPWLGWTDGTCRYCRSAARTCATTRASPATTSTAATPSTWWPTSASASRCPDGYDDVQVAPLLCAGLIGYRTLRLAGDAERLGIYGFGAAASIIAQVALHQGRRVFAFTRAGDEEAQRFALELGAEWAGDSLGPPPEELDAALIFAPVGALVPAALRAVAKGGTVVCGGIHMSDIPAMPVRAPVGRAGRSGRWPTSRARDAEEFLALAPRVPVRTAGGDVPARGGERGARQAPRGEPARLGGTPAVIRACSRARRIATAAAALLLS